MTYLSAATTRPLVPRVDDERVDELTTRTHVDISGTCACLDVDVCGSARIANRAYGRARRGVR